MRLLRRNDLSARVELLPLIDVIFLLLTFFIYSLIVMQRTQVLPVDLPAIRDGARLQADELHAITIDAAGRLYFDRQPVTREELRSRLAEFASNGTGTLLLAAEEEGHADRLPLFLEVWEMIRAAGIRNFSFVGEPSTPAAPPAPSNP